MMDPKVKAKWLKALRGRKYKQGRFSLNNGDGTFCCLGVLCDIVGAEWRDESAYLGDAMIGDGTLKQDFRRTVGITKRACGQLVNMNDGQSRKGPKDFKQIADFIETRL